MTALSMEEKEQKLQEAYDEFMRRLREIEHEQLGVFNRLITESDREEIQKILDSLKE